MPEAVAGDMVIAHLDQPAWGEVVAIPQTVLCSSD
jgi:hypothetical protein